MTTVRIVKHKTLKILCSLQDCCVASQASWRREMEACLRLESCCLHSKRQHIGRNALSDIQTDICNSISSSKSFGVKQGCSCCKLRWRRSCGWSANAFLALGTFIAVI